MLSNEENITLNSSAVWGRALTVEERLAIIRSNAFLENFADRDLGTKRLLRWRTVTPLHSDKWFARKLHAEDMTEDDFTRALGLDLASLDKCGLPAPYWVTQLHSVLSRHRYSSASTNAAANSAVTHDDISAERLLSVFQPLLLYVREELRLMSRTLRPEPRLTMDWASVEESVLKKLKVQLLNLSARSLVLELNAARLADGLTGNTSEERFRCFSERLCHESEALKFFSIYPVLAKLSWTFCIQTTAFISDLCRRLVDDWRLLTELLGKDTSSHRLVGIETGAGDQHAGQSVAILRFSNGKSLVYKPRPLAADLCFALFIRWINDEGLRPTLHCPKTLDKNSYGWVEFITASGCSSEASASRFYQRVGALLAVFYVLQTNDMHRENILASDDVPYAVDLESLFHPSVESSDGTTPHIDGATEMLRASVLRVGLLPKRLWANAGRAGVDISGLYGPGDQAGWYKAPRVERLGTDEARIVRAFGVIPASQNRPQLGGNFLRPQDFADDIVRGFSLAYNIFQREKRFLLSPRSPLRAFESVPTRAILRPTAVYAALLNESYHPELLHNALEREMVFDKLWVGAEITEYLEKTVSVEKRQLQSADIPSFAVSPKSSAVKDSSGKAVAGLKAKAGLQDSLNVISNLDAADRNRQVWLIKCSLYGVDAEKASSGQLLLPPRTNLRKAETRVILGEITKIAKELTKFAHTVRGRTSWLGLAYKGSKSWEIEPLGPDLYNGVAGLALFFAQLSRLRGYSKYRSLAKSSLLHCFDLLKDVRTAHGENVPVGGFNGLAGVIYTSVHAAHIWKNSAILQTALELASVAMETKSDSDHDLLIGNAGLLGALIVLHDLQPSKTVKGWIALCAERILADAFAVSNGIAWKNQIPSTRPLTGVSHGNAGIALMLHRAAKLLHSRNIASAVQSALKYERSQFVATRGNWPDYREEGFGGTAAPNGEFSYMVAWCHGAPGIGLTRLKIWEDTCDDECRAEVEVALSTMFSDKTEMSHCLCHGIAGNLELSLECSLRPEFKEVRERHEEAVSFFINGLKKGYCCGTPRGIATPGLMLGLAGIGYGLLRQIDSQLFPSVLTMEGIRRRS